MAMTKSAVVVTGVPDTIDTCDAGHSKSECSRCPKVREVRGRSLTRRVYTLRLFLRRVYVPAISGQLVFYLMSLLQGLHYTGSELFCVRLHDNTRSQKIG